MSYRKDGGRWICSNVLSEKVIKSTVIRQLISFAKFFSSANKFQFNQLNYREGLRVLSDYTYY